MALGLAVAGEVVDLRPFGEHVGEARTAAIVKTDEFEAVRLVLAAGTEIPPHRVPGQITLHCLEGRVELWREGESLHMRAGDWIYLAGSELHGLKGIEDASLLLTILLRPSGPRTGSG